MDVTRNFLKIAKSKTKVIRKVRQRTAKGAGLFSKTNTFHEVEREEGFTLNMSKPRERNNTTRSNNSENQGLLSTSLADKSSLKVDSGMDGAD